jgi:hypothetical protein
MSLRRSLWSGCLALIAVTLAACGGSSSSGSAGATSEGTSTAPLRGVIALGHSALTGANSDPSNPGADAPKNSWATGTNPAVDSIYRRLAAIDPTAQGHAANEAVDGAKAGTLVNQAQAALKVVPNPRLVIIQTIDNDIRCDGNDGSNYVPFGHEVAAALRVLVQAAPKTTILIMAQPGRPLPSSEAIVHIKPAATAQSGTGMCDPFNPNLTINHQHIVTLTNIISRYERQQSDVCVRFSQCHTNRDIASQFRVLPTYYTPDWNHLNVTGLAALSAYMWPTVKETLNQ